MRVYTKPTRREVLSQNGTKEDVNALRTITEDLKTHYETLPNLKRSFAFVGAIVTFALGAASFMGFGSSLSGLMQSSNWFSVLSALSVPALIGGIVGLFLGTAFSMKRYLFRFPAKAEEHWKGAISPSKDKHVAEQGSSMYGLEADVYSLLGSSGAKPKEIPVDIISYWWTGAVAIAFYFLLMAYPIILGLIAGVVTDWKVIPSLTIFPSIYALAFVAKPAYVYWKTPIQCSLVLINLVKKLNI
jgi:hypothetical protein